MILIKFGEHNGHLFPFGLCDSLRNDVIFYESMEITISLNIEYSIYIKFSNSVHEVLILISLNIQLFSRLKPVTC